MCALRSGPPSRGDVRSQAAALRRRDEADVCRRWVGSGSSIFALDRPLRRIDLTFSCSVGGVLRFLSSRCLRRPPTGHLGGGPRSESVAGSNWKWWPVWIGIAGAFGREYAFGRGRCARRRCAGPFAAFRARAMPGHSRRDHAGDGRSAFRSSEGLYLPVLRRSGCRGDGGR